MADLSSLDYKSITTLSYNEGIQLILSIRESRRKVKPKATKSKSPSTKVKKEKLPNVTPEQAARLLEMLTNKLGE